MKTYEIPIVATVSEQFLMDVLETFVFGGNYWANIEKVYRNVKGYPRELVGLTDREDGTALCSRVMLVDVARGLKLAAAYRNKQGQAPQWVYDVVQAVMEEDCGYIDAEIADCIVQLAALGDIVYG